MSPENFATMLDMAKQEIVKARSEKDFQVIVIEYATGEFEKFLLPDPDFYDGEAVVSAAKAHADPRIKSIVCMWSNGGVDLPSYSLRASLCGLAEENGSAEILLQGYHSFVVKEIRKTLK